MARHADKSVHYYKRSTRPIHLCPLLFFNNIFILSPPERCSKKFQVRKSKQLSHQNTQKQYSKKMHTLDCIQSFHVFMTPWKPPPNIEKTFQLHKGPLLLDPICKWMGPSILRGGPPSWTAFPLTAALLDANHYGFPNITYQSFRCSIFPHSIQCLINVTTSSWVSHFQKVVFQKVHF